MTGKVYLIFSICPKFNMTLNSFQEMIAVIILSLKKLHETSDFCWEISC